VNSIKRFEIKKTVSTKEWGEVDKSKIWQKLKDGIAEGLAGVKQAVREVYATVKTNVNEDLTKADTWGPHHEIRENGDVVLNKAGLFAAAAALAGARTEPDLTPEQKEAARKHLLRHYKELEEEPPESLAGEMSSRHSLEARISGEMRPEDIPLASGVDLTALKKDDPDPLEVVVEIPAGKSKRGWNYTGESLKDIVNYVKENTLSGFLGHQKPENVETEFPPPVTHWVGAVMRNGKAYFRGVVDAAAKDLKRWIRAKRVKQVSIFGAPKLKVANGEIQVVGYNPLSIDWTPLNRMGMPTRVVAVGEMDSTYIDASGELDGSYDEILSAVENAAQKRWGGAERFCYLRRVYPNYAIIVTGERGQPETLYQVPYTIEDGEVKLGEAVKVEEKKEYVPVAGEINTGGGSKLTLQEMLAAVRTAMAKGETDFQKVLGEIGVTKEQAIEMLVGEQMKSLKADSETLAKIQNILGVTGAEAVNAIGEMFAVWKALEFDQKKPEKPAEVAGEMKASVEEAKKQTREKLIDDTIKEKVVGEQAQALIKDMLHVDGEVTKEQLVGEIDSLLAKDYVKALIGKQHIDRPAGLGGGNSDEKRQHTNTKTVPIA